MDCCDTNILPGTLVLLGLGSAALCNLQAQQRWDDLELEELRLRALLAQTGEREQE
jgi:hypothetical protein